MNICRECLHRDYYRTSVDGMCVVDVCRLHPLAPRNRNPVTGRKYPQMYGECTEINQVGRCEDFERKPWWRSWR